MTIEIPTLIVLIGIAFCLGVLYSMMHETKESAWQPSDSHQTERRHL